ncbi:flagellar filament capping protein FliD [uncultured Clostridium sp.]|uniref:flagellar filament capping protein FliD n=1 Tax=uncultured Clostridium sp. TaxID=59620 RepID=UPI0026328BB3|nr:flagellar filament capping protein FliD [uncultured Clostridium sp.]
MRIGGLASGLDTDTMVKQMMMPYQMKVDRVKQDSMLLDFKQQLYRDINKEMRDLYTKYFDVGSTANKDTNLILNSNYDTVSFESSNKGVVTATGLAGAKTGKYDVEVKNMASASSMTISKEAIESIPADKDGKKVFKLNLDGKEVSVELTDKMVDKDGKVNTQEVTNGINSAIKTYNSDSANKEKIDVKVEHSELGDNIRITGTRTGEENDIELAMTDIKGTKVLLAEKENAKDALVEITDSYGNSKEIKKATNQFTIDNVQYTLNSESKAGEKTSLTGSHDVDGVVENIGAFVKDYNALIDKMNGLVTQKRDKNYQPLTDEQKKEMSEDEIKIWELKTKQGLLRGDDILEGTINSLLGTISSTTSGSQLKDIGFSPFSDYKTGKGKIEFNEEKMREALTTNGDETRKMLTGTFSKMKDIVYDTAVKSSSLLNEKAGYEGGVTSFNNEITKKMEEQQKMVTKMMRSFTKKENRYYSEFARLEVAMNKANAQMSQFMSMG